MTRLRTLIIGLSVLLAAATMPGCGAGEPNTSAALTPLEIFATAISQIYVEQDPQDPMATLATVIAISEELRSGVPFAELARRHATQEESASRGGWRGFSKSDGSAMSAAAQAVPPGQVGGPVKVEKGFVFIRRHTLDEARALEQEFTTPAYGFFLPYGNEMGAGATKESTQKQAQKAWEAVKSGKLTLPEAAREFGAVPAPRPDYFIGNIGNDERMKPIYEGVNSVGPGELAPLLELPDAYAVIKRGVYFRSAVRHIIVRHKEGEREETEVTRTRDQARAQAEEALANVLKRPSTWAEAVMRYSDEPEPQALQGGIGIVTNGDLPPALDAAVLETKPGTIVDHLVESEDAFHVVWRVN